MVSGPVSDSLSRLGAVTSTFPAVGRDAASIENSAEFFAYKNGDVTVRFLESPDGLATSIARALPLVRNAPQVTFDFSAIPKLDTDSIGKLIHDAPQHTGSLILSLASIERLQDYRLIDSSHASQHSAFKWRVHSSQHNSPMSTLDFEKSSALQSFFSTQVRSERASNVDNPFVEVQLSGRPALKTTLAPLEGREGVCLTLEETPRSDEARDVLTQMIIDLPISTPAILDLTRIDTESTHVAHCVLQACKKRSTIGAPVLEVAAGEAIRRVLRPEIGVKFGFQIQD